MTDLEPVEDYQIMSTMTRVFIASQSPRRREILSSKFNDITILKLESPEEPRWEKNQTPDAYITHCVNFKSDYAESAFLQKVSPSQRVGHNLVVVADTVVELDNKIFGKPDSAAEATQILKALSGRKHIVKTQVCTLVFNQEGAKIDKVEFCSQSFVKFFKLKDSEIKEYIKTKEPFDKAGAYGLQDRALKFVESIEGSYLNIVGFPLEMFLHSIKKYLL